MWRRSTETVRSLVTEYCLAQLLLLVKGNADYVFHATQFIFPSAVRTGQYRSKNTIRRSGDANVATTSLCRSAIPWLQSSGFKSHGRTAFEEKLKIITWKRRHTNIALTSRLIPMKSSHLEHYLEPNLIPDYGNKPKKKKGSLGRYHWLDLLVRPLNMNKLKQLFRLGLLQSRTGS